MKRETVTAQITKAPDLKEGETGPHLAQERVKKEYSVTVDWPESLEEAAQMWTAEVSLAKLLVACTIDLQSSMRNVIKSDEFSQDALQNAADGYSPSQRRPAMSGRDRAAAFLGTLDAEELAAFIAEAQEKKEEAAA